MGRIPGDSMGFGLGLENLNMTPKQKHRWLFGFADVSAQGIGVMPPSRAARPGVGFKELEVQHLNETIYFPGKPEFKTITLAFYDICSQHTTLGKHPIMNWLMRLFDPERANYGFIIDDTTSVYFKLDATLELYDPCGNCLEKWMFDNCWPQSCDFQDLDMGSSEVLLAEVILRYDRAYIVNPSNFINGPGLAAPTPNANARI